MVKSLARNVRNASLIPGLGAEILDATEQLSPCTTTMESVRCGGGVPQLRLNTGKEINI